MNNDEVRKLHAIMECNNEISWCKMVINSKASEQDKESARQRLKIAEDKKKQIEST